MSDIEAWAEAFNQPFLQSTERLIKYFFNVYIEVAIYPCSYDIGILSFEPVITIVFIL